MPLPTPHVIRLRGPWELSWHGDGIREAPHRVRLPDGLPEALARRSSAPSATTLRLTRRFGCPTGVSAADRILLEIIVAPQPLAVLLNGESLGRLCDDAQQFGPVALTARNRLDLDWHAKDVPTLEARLLIFPDGG